MLLTPITTAGRMALATWITSELAALDGLVVSPHWFERDRPLPTKAIAIIDAGPRRIEWLDPEVLASSVVPQDAPGGQPDRVLVTWKLGFVEQRVTLDVWAPSEVAIEDLVARLDGVLNAGQRARTVPPGNVNPIEPGVVVDLAHGWAPGIAAFRFDEPDIEHTASSVGESEWRASYRGVFDALLTQQAESPAIARVLLRQRINAASADVHDITPTP